VKKCLLAFLILVVAFQSAWAATGAYCAHENGAASFHFGHHFHRHHGKSDGTDKKTSSAKADSDCGACHSSAPALAAMQKLPTPPFLARFYFSSVPTIYTSHISDAPRRPDRTSVA
jgi:cytochrome c553